MNKKCLARIGALMAGCLLMASATLPCNAATEAHFAQIDAYVQTQMDRLDIPGMAIAIVEADKVVYQRGYGQAAPDGRAVTPQTPFTLGSTGKSITALAVMQLVEAGYIDLDAPVQTYIPWFVTADAEASARITVLHLLNQTSGFSNATGLKELIASDLGDDAIESSVRRLKDAELTQPPGSTHQYSNVNYTILGLIVQIVSGEPYEAYVQRVIFEPLEMKHSFVSQAEAVQDGLARGHVTWFGIPIAKDIPFNRGHLPSGFQMSSVEDMAHFLVSQINGGNYGETSVLSPQGIAAMHRPAVSAGSPDEFYGMGWYIGPTSGFPSFHHEGDNVNSATGMVIVPEKQLGVIVMMNSNGTFMATAHRQIASGIVAVMTGQQPNPYEAPEELTKVVGSVVVPAAVSVLWIAWMAYRFARRRRKGGPTKRSAWWTLSVIILPLMVDFALLLVLLVGVPTLWGLPMSALMTMFPDMATLIFGTAAAVAVWGLTRTALTMKDGKCKSLAADEMD